MSGRRPDGPASPRDDYSRQRRSSGALGGGRAQCDQRNGCVFRTARASLTPHTPRLHAQDERLLHTEALPTRTDITTHSAQHVRAYLVSYGPQTARMHTRRMQVRERMFHAQQLFDVQASFIREVTCAPLNVRERAGMSWDVSSCHSVHSSSF